MVPILNDASACIACRRPHQNISEIGIYGDGNDCVAAPYEV